MTQTHVTNGTLGGYEWTGRIQIDLRIAGDCGIGGCMDAKITRDAVHLWFAQRSVADMDRERFRTWLHDTGWALYSVDDITWAHHDGSIWVTIFQNFCVTAVYTITPETHRTLLEII